MNGTPHSHNVLLNLDGYEPSITYGDTKVRLFHTHPSVRRVTRLTRRAIKRHDKGSLHADEAARKINKRVQKLREKQRGVFEAAEKVRSDWYMDSPERMDSLHSEAHRENERRTWADNHRYLDPYPPDDSGPFRTTKTHTFGLMDVPSPGRLVEK